MELIYQFMNICVGFTFCRYESCSCEHPGTAMFSLLLGVYLGVALLDHAVIVYLIFWETAQLLSSVATPFYISTNKVERFHFLHILMNIFLFFLIAIIAGVRWYLIVVLICFSLMVNVLFMCLLANYRSFLEKYLFTFLALLKIVLSFYCWVLSILYMFWLIDPSQIHDLEILWAASSCSWYCPWKNTFNFDEVQLIFPLVAYAFLFFNQAVLLK